MTSPLTSAMERLRTGVFLYIRECFVCMELKNSDSKVECLWMSIKGKAGKADNPAGSLVPDHPTRMKRWMNYML